MATSDSETLLALTRYILRVYANDTASIEALADQAFSDLQAGRTITSISYEGASTSSTLTAHPALLLNACEDALAQLGVAGSVRSSSRSIFTRFGSQVVQS
jgi:hypothetical protein